MSFDGINYKGNLWINGHLFISNVDFIGTFRKFTFDITHFISISDDKMDNTNVIALEVFHAVDNCFPPTNNSTDLALSFIDWNPPPPDYSMGIWKPVKLTILTNTNAAQRNKNSTNTARKTDHTPATLKKLWYLFKRIFNKYI